MNKAIKKQFVPFRGSLDQVIDHAFRQKCATLGKLIFQDHDPEEYKRILFERKFWSETFDRMLQVKRTS